MKPGAWGQCHQLTNFAGPCPPTKYIEFCLRENVNNRRKTTSIKECMGMGNVVAPSEVEAYNNERSSVIFTREVLMGDQPRSQERA